MNRIGFCTGSSTITECVASARDLDRIVFVTACYPPLLRSFLRLLLGRAAGRGQARPICIGVGEIEQTRASEAWRQAASGILLDPVRADPVARMVLLQFVFEFLMQDQLDTMEGNLEIERDELDLGIGEVSKGVVDERILDASLDTLRTLDLVFTSPDRPTRFLMSIPMAAGLNALVGDDIDRLNEEAVRELAGG